MRMVPASPHDTGSQAEKRIFERLRTALDERYVAYHSLRPTRHPHKRFPEIDFVICGAEGLYVIEVKGGRITCHAGVWQYRDRYGRTTPSHEGPFRQAQTSLHGLMEDLRANLPADVLDRFTIGYGVVFPDCDWRSDGAEWDPEMLADKRRSRDMEGWLRSLFEYWRRRDGREGQPDDGALRRLQEHLRPEVGAPASEENVPLLHQVKDARRRIERLTEDQVRMADVAEANPRVLCAGGAGTGKTFLAERLARRWCEAGAQVALVCRSPWLRHFLASRLSMPGLAVSLIDGVRLDCRRAGLERFDALIVDEGQDLFEMGSIETLDEVLAGGLAQGRWCWFHDLNNQSLTRRFDRRAKDYLESLGPVHVPLRINCRNTRVILEWIQEALGADLGVRGAGAGPDVRLHTAVNRREAGERVAREIVELVDVGGLSPGSVTILSPFDLDESSVAVMPAEVAGRVRRLDEYSMRALPGDTVGFARIEEFKGLENEAIVVADLPVPDETNRDSTAHYVAMSRARSVLSLVYRDPPRALGPQARGEGRTSTTHLRSETFQRFGGGMPTSSLADGCRSTSAGFLACSRPASAKIVESRERCAAAARRRTRHAGEA